MKKVLGGLSLTALLVVGVVLGRAWLLDSRQLEVTRVPAVELDVDRLAETLAGALRFRTLSPQPPAPRPEREFEAFARYLEESFPRVHRQLVRERVGGHSLLYTWPGARPELRPVLLAAHMDVVPAEDELWTHPPFAGVIADGHVWGRGALDDKGSLVATLEAVEGLLGDGYRPPRTIVLAFGHDEELGGEEGARGMAELLERRGVELALVLDEGSAVTLGLLPKIERPIALVGVAEKGSLNVALTVDGAGGHSSTPPRHTAIGQLATALVRLESNPLPAALDDPLHAAFAHLAPELPFPHRVVFGNLWATRWLVERAMADAAITDAGLRTTTAVTVVGGGVKSNVLPKRARAVVNFRIHPRDDTRRVLAHVGGLVEDLPVRVEPLPGRREPSPIAPVDGPAFALVHRTIRELDPEVLVAPSLVLGGTDARHYAGLTDAVYRFVYYRLGGDDVSRLHGVDERISSSNYAELVRFYRRFVVNAGAAAARGLP